MSLTHRDASNEGVVAMHYPEVVHALERLGFMRIGRVGASLPPGMWDALVSAYAPDDGAKLAAAERLPPVVLAAEDGSAFADVDWFWDAPSLRLRSLLTDGRLVETQLAWANPPAWPARLDRARRYRDEREEQWGAEARGRIVTIVEGTSPVDVCSRHQQVLADVGAAPLEHRDMAQVVTLYNAATLHADSCALRARAVARTLYVALAVVPALVFTVLMLAGQLVGALVLVAVWAVATFFSPAIGVRVRYVRWLRPGYPVAR